MSGFFCSSFSQTSLFVQVECRNKHIVSTVCARVVREQVVPEVVLSQLEARMPQCRPATIALLAEELKIDQLWATDSAKDALQLVVNLQTSRKRLWQCDTILFPRNWT